MTTTAGLSPVHMRLLDLVGRPLSPSGSEVVEQWQVDAHAETTGDSHWIHNDPARAALEGPFGAPVVQGFLLLSLLTRLVGQNPSWAEIGHGVDVMINYGVDRVRFCRPVHVGARVYAQCRLQKVEPKGVGRLLLTVEVQLMSDRLVDPAVVAEWKFLVVEMSDAP